ncbi:MAG: hypothetical protein DMG15_27910 [Acidobacteria bacterium]|nr:MAG: hypothetical protein DMG15_27910 [Acidobacteriota bacterium]
MYFLCKAHISRQVYMKDSERSAGRILRGRLGTVVVTLSVLLTFALAASAQVQSGYIVMFRPGTTRAARADLARRAGAVMRFNYSIVDAIAVRALNANARALLQQDRSVIAIVPDFPIYGVAPRLPGLPPPPQDPSDPQTIPAGVSRVGVPWEASNGDGIGVAIHDTGIDFGHPDLAPAADWFTAVGESCQDDHGHGTHVTGIIAALDNDIDVVGVAPKATPYCVKVLDSTFTGSDSNIIAGLDWVFSNNAILSPPIRAVNMSLGRDGTLDDNPALRAAVSRLYDLGIVMVVAAGNDQSLEVSQRVPAGYPEVLAIAAASAVDGQNSCPFAGPILADTAAYFTTDGRYDPDTGIGISVSAPGEEEEDTDPLCTISSLGILSTSLGGGTTRLSGTSMATAHVTGIVARLMQSGMSGVENIRGFIRSSANRIGIAPLDSPFSEYTFDGEREGIAQAP